MGSFCCKLLTSTCILPFVAGNYRRQQNGSRFYDCNISSRVLFLIVLAIVIVFTASKTIAIHAEGRLGIVLLLLSLLTVTAMIGISILGCLVRKQGLHSVVAARRTTGTPKLQVIFLWGFGLASVLHCALFIGKQIECFVEVTGGLFWNVLFCFNILLILGLLFETIFITYFSSFKLKQTTLVNYVMLLILTTNIAVLIYIYLIQNTLSYLTKNYPKGQIVSCLENNSTITDIKDKVRQVLNPTFVEYGLLSTTIILEIWSPTEVHRPHIGSPYMEISDTEDVERVPLIQDTTPIEQLNSENRGNITLCQMITLVVSLTTGLGLVVCYAVMAMNVRNIENVRYVAEIYELTLKVTMVLAIFAGFYCVVHYCTPDSSSNRLKPREYVYVFSAFGLFMTHIWEGIGGDVSSDHSVMSTSIFSIFQDYLQVVFLLHAKRCKKSDPRPHVNLLESVLIFTMITNLTFWFNDSFFLYEYPNTRILEYDKFPRDLLIVVYNVLLPVSVFFRFTSFLEYYETFCEYKT